MPYARVDFRPIERTLVACRIRLYCASNPPNSSISVEDSSPTCVPVPTTRFQLLALAQSVFSALLVFFVALALRNFFKLR
jgi:hypothetical protein